MIMVDQCPFCGETQIEIHEADVSRYVVDCPTCLATGPIKDSIMGSIGAWNKATRLELLNFEIPATT